MIARVSISHKIDCLTNHVIEALRKEAVKAAPDAAADLSTAQFFNPLHGRELTHAQAARKAADFSLVLKPKQG